MFNFVKTWLKKNIDDYLLTLTKPEGVVIPAGFNAAENIRNASKQWVIVPFGSGMVCVQLRVLSAGEMPQVSVIETASRNALKSREDMIRLLNLQEEICRSVMLCPTFEQAEKEILGGDGVAQSQRAKLKELQEKVKDMPENTKKTKLFNQLNKLELATGYFLPSNFMCAVVNWALCLDVTDVKRLTPERLIEAYRLSQMYHNRASDNIQGIFCDYQRREIDILAAYLSAEDDKKHKPNNRGKKYVR
ncbi:hypothetical protein NO1_0594 [Candidatus Termititenax aidoneus]|uniref:Uncharacterized protein n=1 Tax=Termititenax aidoneus TaxID=2218524 RepID=A0A388TA78_TERA1|nr:hypothetical protein NO1_0594 [Candidatus Termititenax aidoneus]